MRNEKSPEAWQGQNRANEVVHFRFSIARTVVRQRYDSSTVNRQRMITECARRRKTCDLKLMPLFELFQLAHRLQSVDATSMENELQYPKVIDEIRRRWRRHQGGSGS